MITCLAGCQKVPTHQGLLETTTPETTLSSRKLRSLLTDYVPRFAIQIEETADQILAESTDAEIRRNALLWKSNAISACFQAAARPDSLAAFLDVWILNRQMTQLFEHPPENPHFGPWQELAIQTSRQLELPLRDIQSKLGTGAIPGGKGVTLGEDFVADFALKYPVRSLYFDRQSLAAPFIQQVSEETREVLQVVSGLNENLTELQRLLALYAEFLPKQARWQSELLLLSSTSSAVLAEPLREVAVISRAMDRLATTAESSPALLERERLALHEIVADERAVIMQDIERMRGETLEQLTSERVAVLSALREERNQVGQMVAVVTDNTLDKMDQVIEQRTHDATATGGRLLEKAMERILWLVVVGGILTLLMLLVVQRILRQRPAAARNRSLDDDESSPIRIHRESALHSRRAA